MSQYANVPIVMRCIAIAQLIGIWAHGQIN